MSSAGEDLGDILARRMSEPDTGIIPAPSDPHDFDELIVALARMGGEKPGEILREFHGNSALGRLMRKLLGVDFYDQFSSDEKVYLRRVFISGEQNLRGRSLDVAVAESLNSERNAAGERAWCIDAASIRPTAHRGRKAFRERGLPSLFGKRFRSTDP